MKVRLLPALALGAALATAGCQHPDGSTDWGSTLALGAGLGLAAGALAASASDSGHRYRQPPRYDRGSYGYGRPYAQGYGRGYGRGWR
ncbi:hypothetical protein J8J14_04340 [Roseomonas sp. SSH11]|uniref:Lipoprotein n=1 Tax=Pararoseomonas baculiformis TaxID=2820812 RepID=A0ABS4AAH7_9PROT|nr:hypothetical protein [Pararoseomonas baculiformis]MBP0443998.1 hypothetical protein [Pararoseomonas baculiformis]